MGLKEFQTRISPSVALIVEFHGPCKNCSRGGTPARLFLALGTQGGGKLKGLKAVEGELGLCDGCRRKS
ncbi:MAG: hypothetical protein V3U30_04130 [Thermoplasmata archaeon]